MHIIITNQDPKIYAHPIESKALSFYLRSWSLRNPCHSQPQRAHVGFLSLPLLSTSIGHFMLLEGWVSVAEKVQQKVGLI